MSRVMEISIEVIGWAGAIALLYAYYLIQTNRVGRDHNLYMMLNIAGAFCLFVNTLYHKAYPSVVTNGLWFLLGLVVAFNIWKQPVIVGAEI